MKSPVFLTTALLAAATPMVLAQTTAPAKPAKPAAAPGGLAAPAQNATAILPDKGGGELDLTQFPGQIIDEVVVPVPSEIFSVLDKLGDPDWKAQVSTTPKPSLSERTDVALLLGATVADGFIAVQAEDKTAVQDVGRNVLSLAGALGVKDDVLRHCQAIDEAAGNAMWDTVRQELDTTQATVRNKMQQMQDGALAECISVGGWLRGTQVITAIITKQFSTERAELLYQPDLAQYFNTTLEEMLVKAKNPAKLKDIANGLARIQELMDNGGGDINAAAVSEMNAVTARLVKKITTKP
jgi:hypothetical protein